MQTESTSLSELRRLLWSEPVCRCMNAERLFNELKNAIYPMAPSRPVSNFSS